MSTIFNNIDPIYIYRRDGNENNPYKDYTETLTVANNRVILSEIPEEFHKVTVKDLNDNFLYETTSQNPDVNQYYVDYNLGIVYFNEVREGEKLTFIYKGIGYVSLSSKRIYIEHNGEEPTKTLQDLVNETAQARDSANEASDNLVHKGEYDNTAQYKKRNIVTYQGSAYMAIVDTQGNPPTDENYWKKLTAFSWKGIYDSGVTYNAGDFVQDADQRNLYLSLTDLNTGNPLTDTTKWKKLITIDDIVNTANQVIADVNIATANANDAANNANTQATNAQNAAQSANDAATNANNAANNANTKATYAQQQGDYAKAQGDYAKQVADENKTRWLNPVATFADIATTYPNPQHGDTVMVTDDGENSGSVYRYENDQWKLTQKHNDLAIADVQNKIGILKSSIIYPEFFGASPTATASQNRQAIQQALDIGGYVFLGTPGTYLIDDTLKIGDNTTFELGSGVCIKLASGINKNMLQNKGYTSGSRNKNITLKGGTWDYDEANKNFSGLNSIAILMKGVDGLTLRDITGLNVKKYVFLLADIYDLTVDTLHFNTASDGLHLQGPITKADIRNLKGTTGDDMLAFTIGDYTSYEISRGDFVDITVDGLYPKNALTAVKIAGNAPYKIKNLSISNVYGNVINQTFYFQNDTNLLQTDIDDVFIKNVKTSSNNSNTVMMLRVNTIENLVMENVTHLNGVNIVTVDQNTVVKNLILKKLSSKWSCTTGLISISAPASVNKLTIDGVDAIMGDATGACIVEVRGTVGDVTLRSIQATFPAGNGDIVRHISGSIKTLKISDLNQTKGNHIYYQVTTGFPTILIYLRDINVDTLGTGVDLKNSAEVRVNGFRGTGFGGYPIVVNGGTVYVVGQVEFTEKKFVQVSSGTAYVNGIGIRVDVSQLAKRQGDIAHNVNAGLACGLGPVVCDGTNWKNLYTGAIY
jgi:hypothetical protein